MATSINCLAVVLKELDWSYTRLIAELPTGHSTPSCSRGSVMT